MYPFVVIYQPTACLHPSRDSFLSWALLSLSLSVIWLYRVSQ